MAATATKFRTIRAALNTSKEGEMDDALLKAQLGNMLVPMKYTVVGLTSATAIDITTAAVAAAATPGAFSPALNTPDDIRVLPAAHMIASLRVTAGAAAAGLRQIGDSGATPSATVATLSENGKTITFEAGVTAFVIDYVPRSATDLQSAFASLA